MADGSEELSCNPQILDRHACTYSYSYVRTSDDKRFKGIVLPFVDQIHVLLTFSTSFRPLCFFRPVCDQNAVEKDDKNCF